MGQWNWLDWAVVVAVICGAFFRLYNIPLSFQFLGDQGRDVLIVARMFKELDPVFIGPVTSVGNMYLGPLYYYFMLPWLWLTYPSPLGPQYAVAVLGIVANWLIWVLGKRMMGKWPAAIATVLFAFSQVAVEYTRFSWNPNPIPLVSLLMLYSTFRASKGAYWHWVLVGLYGSVILQLHYMAALTGIAAMLVWVQQLVVRRSDAQAVRSLCMYAALATLVLVLSFTPLVLFDYRNGWLNTHAFQELLTADENFGNHIDASPVGELQQTLLETHGRSMHILFEIFIGKNRLLNTALVALYAGVLLQLVKASHRKKVLRFAPGLPVVLIWLLVGILGTSVYKHTVFDHYIGFEYPVAVLVSGYVLTQLIRWQKSLGLPVVIVVMTYIVFNIGRMPVTEAGWSIYDMEKVSHAIAQRVVPGEKYNIVLFSHTRDLYGMNYRYFLETTDTQPVREANWTEAETLFVIDEERSGADVFAAPVHEIVTFPSKVPREMFEVDGVQVWVLRVNP